jgi:murein endopeptidase
MKSFLKKVGVAASTATAFVGANAMAAVDVAGVTTELGNAEQSAQSVGTAVIGVVAGIAAVSIIIALIRRI